MNRFQRERFNKEALEDTLFPNAFLSRSSIILSAEVIEDEESDDFEDAGVYIPDSFDSPSGVENFYKRGMGLGSYFFI